MFKKLETIANVKMGTKTFAELNRDTAEMSPYEKIDYFHNLVNSVEFVTTTAEYLEKARSRGMTEGQGRKVLNLRIMSYIVKLEIRSM